MAAQVARALQLDGWEALGKAASRPLFVKRPLLNYADVAAWAKEQGFATTLAEDMHVTIAFSHAPVDWAALTPELWEIDVTGSQERSVERLGDQGATVLRFQSSLLSGRWQEIRDAGASWGYDSYHPHVTISYSPPADLAAVEPYAGSLIFGPEEFKPVKENWTDDIKEKASQSDEWAHHGRIDPQLARRVTLPIADEIQRAHATHIAWEAVRSGKAETSFQDVPIADMVATQALVGEDRVANDRRQFEVEGHYPEPPLAVKMDGRCFILAGHHRVEGAIEAGASELPLEVIEGHT